MTANEIANTRRSISEEQARHAGIAAREALAADASGSPMSDAEDRLFGAVGYWAEARGDVAVFRGERLPPKMLRMPRGRSLLWPRHKWAALDAWAQVE
jgi:hypothetical protein